MKIISYRLTSEAQINRTNYNDKNSHKSQRAHSHNMSFSEGNVGQVNSYSYNKFFTIKLKLMENSINSSENFTESSKPEPEF